MSKSAREMFEELGYEEFYDDEEYKEEHIQFIQDGIFICFHKNEKRVETWELDDYFDIYNHLISPQELQAINQMCKELGWLDEK